MEKKPKLQIIIVGAGIAGLAAAVALRPLCSKITIVERSRMLKETGALISLQPNASKILSSWGIEHFLDRYGPMIDGAFRIFDQGGTLVQEIDLSDSKLRFGADRVLYHRQDLHAALKDAATSARLRGCAAEILAGCAVESCKPELAEVVLSDGRTLRADIVIGADGIHSVIRTAVVGEPRKAIPTGLSAYRMLVPMSSIADIEIPKQVLDPAKPSTAMIVGRDRRVIMGPGRNGTVLGIVALIPDEEVGQPPTDDSWVCEGSLDAVLERYKDFPDWLLETFKRAPDTALWQLRDIEPVPGWTRGRTILIGDAAHAMLPTQGQGASQSFEDAEALFAFLGDLPDNATASMIHEALERVFQARRERAGLIQAYSRQQARSGTDAQTNEVNLNPGQFMAYNCEYRGAKDWESRLKMRDSVKETLL